ncbi:MAG: hypothetical protein ABSF62_18950 [Bryobacteraceae bacterium]
MDDGLTDTAIDFLWIDQANPSTLLAGTEFDGIFRTADGGQSWTQVSANGPVSAIVSVPGGILAGTGSGFELSTDDGVTWAVIQPTTSPVRCLAIGGSYIIAGLDDGDVLWKGPSDRSWRTVANNPQETIFDVAVDPINPNVAFYILPGTVFRTTDGAASWQAINSPGNQTIVVRPSDEAVLVAGGGTFYKSLDSGTTWTQLNAPWDNRRIFLIPGSSSLVMGSDHGLHWTDNDGVSWRDLSGPISSNILLGVAVNGQTIFASAQDFGPLLTLDGGATWIQPGGATLPEGGSVASGLGEGGGGAINPGNPKYCYAFTTGGLSVSQDGCATFSPVAGPTWQNYVSAANENLITVDPLNAAAVYVGASDGVWASTDWGLTFHLLTWPVQQVTQVVFDSKDESTVYVCTRSGLYQTLNGGATWMQLALPTFAYPYSAAVSPTNSNLVLVALNEGAGRSQGGVLKSTDRGMTFQFANQGLSTVLYNLGEDQLSIAFNPVVPTGTNPVAALTTSSGVYVSGDLANTWQNIRFNAVPFYFSGIQWDRGYLWAATLGQGILRSDQPLSSASFTSTLAVTGGPVWFTNTMGVSAPTGSETLQVTAVGASQSFTVAANLGSNAGCGNWLTASPISGATTGTITGAPVTVSYTVTGLPAYSNTTCSGAVTVTTAGANGSSVTIPVTLVISPQPCSFALSTGGQAFPVAGGSGTVSVATSGPCGAWSASNTLSWITLTGGASGMGAGIISYQVAANSGGARTGLLTIAGLPFAVEQAGASALAFAGSMAQIASAGGWDTSLTLVNLGAASGEARLNFYANDGSAPQLPFTFPQQPSLGAILGSTFDQNLNAGATLVLDSTGTASQTTAVGWAQLLTSGNIGGFAVFDYTPTGQQAVVPVETRNASSYLLAFDDTGALATGLAIANLATSPASVGVVIRDDTGAQIGTGTISLPAQGHNSFMLTDSTYGFPATAGRRGTVEFDTPQNGRISVLGLRANGAAITTLPVLANVGTTGGALAHVASGGGWQTIFTVVNTGTASANATLSFFADDGSRLSLPLSFPQTSTTATETSVNHTIPAGATLVIGTQGQPSGASVTGSAQLSTNGSVSGFAIFQNSGQEAVVPLEVSSANSYILAFDNTGSLLTGVAVANSSAQPAAVPATLRDDTGATLATTTISLPGNGHSSQMLTTWFPTAANIRGTLEFDTPSGGQIGALGIRATPAGAYTTIPVMNSLAAYSGLTPPVIQSVTPVAPQPVQEIVILGSGFGNTPPQTVALGDGSVDTVACNVTTPAIAIWDNNPGSGWEAGQKDCTTANAIGIKIASWSDRQIVLNGFGSALGNAVSPRTWNIALGDPLKIIVSGPNKSGTATYNLQVLPTALASGSGAAVVRAISPAGGR